MHEELEPAALTLAGRLREVAVVLATGLLRLRARSALPDIPAASFSPRILTESRNLDRELPAKAVLSVHTG
jgi:hypothetical protein